MLFWNSIWTEGDKDRMICGWSRSKQNILFLIRLEFIELIDFLIFQVLKVMLKMW